MRIYVAMKYAYGLEGQRLPYVWSLMGFHAQGKGPSTHARRTTGFYLGQNYHAPGQVLLSLVTGPSGGKILET